MSIHKNLPPSQNHVPHSFEFNSSAEREAAPVSTSDLGKFALQKDDWSYWSLRSVSPVLWERLGLATEVQAVSLRAPGPGGWRPMTVIFDKAVYIPATPGVVLIDEEIELSPWGILATTNGHANFCPIIEKPDGNGGWIPTNDVQPIQAYDPATYQYHVAPGQPARDPDGYEVAAFITPSPMKLPKLPGGDLPLQQSYGMTVGQDPGRDWDVIRGSFPGLRNDPQPEDRITRARVVAVRTSRVYTAEEQALINTYGYRIRLVLNAVNLVLWEKEVPVVEQSDSMLMDEEVDLADYGLISDHDRFLFVAELRRNGKTVRSYLSNEYVVGEELDPPTYPVGWMVRPVFPGTPWWNTQNSGDGKVLSAGTQYWGALAQCSESVRQHVNVLAWRAGDLVTTYCDGSLVESPIDLTSIAPGMGGVLIARTGIPAMNSDGGSLSQTVNVRFRAATMDTDFDVWSGIWNGTKTVYVRIDTLADGVRVVFKPGVTLLQDVFEAIGSNVPFLGTGTLSTPGFTLTAGLDGLVASATLAGQSVAPMPADAGSNCTLRVRLLGVPPNRLWEYPFTSRDGSVNDVGLAQVMLRNIQAPITFPLGNTEASYAGLGLWNLDGRLKFGSADVTMKSDSFISEEVVGTGAVQAIPHGLGVVPGKVKVVPVKWPAGSACDYSVTSDQTNVNVTMTAGVTYYMVALR